MRTIAKVRLMLVAGLLTMACAGAAWAQVGGHIALARGYDAQSGTLLTLEGSPGTAVARLAADRQFGTSAGSGVAGRYLVLTEEGGVALVTLNGNGVGSVGLPGGLDGRPDSMVLSWEGNAAAVYYGDARAVYVWARVGSAGTASMMASGFPAEAKLVAVSDDARQVLAAVDDGTGTTVWMQGAEAQAVPVWRTQAPVMGLFLKDSAVMVSADGKVVRLDAGTLALREIPLDGDGARRIAAMARAGERVFLADAERSEVISLSFWIPSLFP